MPDCQSMLAEVSMTLSLCGRLVIDPHSCVAESMSSFLNESCCCLCCFLSQFYKNADFHSCKAGYSWWKWWRQKSWSVFWFLSLTPQHLQDQTPVLWAAVNIPRAAPAQRVTIVQILMTWVHLHQNASWLPAATAVFQRKLPEEQDCFWSFYY